jgi:hypothetical protein
MIKTHLQTSSPPNLRITQVATNFIIHSKPLTCCCFCRARQKSGNLRRKEDAELRASPWRLCESTGRLCNFDGRFQCKTVLFVLRGAASFPCGQGPCPDVPVLARQPFSKQRKSTTIFEVAL